MIIGSILFILFWLTLFINDNIKLNQIKSIQNVVDNNALKIIIPVALVDDVIWPSFMRLLSWKFTTMMSIIVSAVVVVETSNADMI